MKMYVFPRENSPVELSAETERPWIGPGADAVITRLALFMLAWTAGAGAAALIAATS